jgi:mRNA-degrading endonuclease toxin of MazEF toxin-antitoxin module
MYDPEYGTLFCLIVSGTQVDLDNTCIAVRATGSTGRHDFPGWVRFGAGDPVAGYAVVHDLDRVDFDELKEDLGEVSQETMQNVNRALRRLLGL